MKLTAATSAAAIAAGLLLASQSASAAQATAEMIDTEGESVGSVTLRSTPVGILVHAELEGLSEGTHAFHIHAVGACEPPFKSAGGHFNPTDVSHGFLASSGPHPGDFPNIHVPASGALEFEAFNPLIRLGDTLLDEDGAAVVIHEGADDYETDPAGDAGSRIACGVIEQ